MIQRLAMALAQEKAGNKSEKLLNEIRKIIYSLYGAKKNNSKKTYNNNKFSKVIKTEWMLYLWVLKVVKHLILTD